MEITAEERIRFAAENARLAEAEQIERERAQQAQHLESRRVTVQRRIGELEAAIQTLTDGGAYLEEQISEAIRKMPPLVWNKVVASAHAEIGTFETGLRMLPRRIEHLQKALDEQRAQERELTEQIDALTPEAVPEAVPEATPTHEAVPDVMDETETEAQQTTLVEDF